MEEVNRQEQLVLKYPNHQKYAEGPHVAHQLVAAAWSGDQMSELGQGRAESCVAGDWENRSGRGSGSLTFCLPLALGRSLISESA